MIRDLAVRFGVTVHFLIVLALTTAALVAALAWKSVPLYCAAFVLAFAAGHLWNPCDCDECVTSPETGDAAS